MKKTLIILCMVLSLFSTSSFADYVDKSNREHADAQNDTIQLAQISKQNEVVIYLMNDSGINYEFGTKIQSYSIPFVEVKSVKVEKLKLDTSEKKELESDYYNKITLKTDKALHEKQRFVIINNFIDGSNITSTNSILMHSIAPLGNTIKNHEPNPEKSASESHQLSQLNITYDDVSYVTSITPQVVLVNFTEDVKLSESLLNTNLYKIKNTDGSLVEINHVVLSKDNQLIIFIAKQDKTKGLTFEAEYIKASPRTSVKHFYSTTSVKEEKIDQNLQTVLDTYSKSDNPDEVAKIVDAVFVSTNILTVQFDKKVDIESASNPDNYTFLKTNHMLNPPTISASEVMKDGKTVNLTYQFEHKKVQSFKLRTSNIKVDGFSSSTDHEFSFYNPQIITQLIEELRSGNTKSNKTISKNESNYSDISIDKVYGQGPNKVVVYFSGKIDRTTAEDLDIYSISDYPVLKSILNDDQTICTIEFDNASDRVKQQKITIDGLEDEQGNLIRKTTKTFYVNYN